MRSSRGEIKIAEILEQNDLDFIEEYSFPDLTSNKGNPLRFDFCVLDLDGEIDFLIEYQGEQHYRPNQKFGKIAKFREQQLYDLRKVEYCKAHNITLIRIPYWDYEIINYDYIMKAAGY